MSTRSEIITSIKTAFEASGFGFSSVDLSVRMPEPEELDFSSFPLAHLYVRSEGRKHLPSSMIEGTLTLYLRIFHNNPSFSTVESMVETVKELFATFNATGANWTKLSSLEGLTNKLNLFHELRATILAEYWYFDTNP